MACHLDGGAQLQRCVAEDVPRTKLRCRLQRLQWIQRYSKLKDSTNGYFGFNQRITMDSMDGFKASIKFNNFLDSWLYWEERVQGQLRHAGPCSPFLPGACERVFFCASSSLLKGHHCNKKTFGGAKHSISTTIPASIATLFYPRRILPYLNGSKGMLPLTALLQRDQIQLKFTNTMHQTGAPCSWKGPKGSQRSTFRRQKDQHFGETQSPRGISQVPRDKPHLCSTGLTPNCQLCRSWPTGANCF